MMTIKNNDNTSTLWCHSIASSKISQRVWDRRVSAPFLSDPREAGSIPRRLSGFYSWGNWGMGPPTTPSRSLAPERSLRREKFLDRLATEFSQPPCLPAMPLFLPESLGSGGKDGGTSPSRRGTPGQGVGSAHTRTRTQAHSHTHKAPCNLCGHSAEPPPAPAQPENAQRKLARRPSLGSWLGLLWTRALPFSASLSGCSLFFPPSRPPTSHPPPIPLHPPLLLHQPRGADRVTGVP